MFCIVNKALSIELCGDLRERLAVQNVRTSLARRLNTEFCYLCSCVVKQSEQIQLVEAEQTLANSCTTWEKKHFIFGKLSNSPFRRALIEGVISRLSSCLRSFRHRWILVLPLLPNPHLDSDLQMIIMPAEPSLPPLDRGLQMIIMPEGSSLSLSRSPRPTTPLYSQPFTVALFTELSLVTLLPLAVGVFSTVGVCVHLCGMGGWAGGWMDGCA